MAFPGDKQSTMTCNFVISRTDTPAKSYDICLVPVAPGKSNKANDFFRIMGEVLAAFTKSCPVVEYSLDVTFIILYS